MNVDKRHTMIKVILDYAFGDEVTVVGFDEPAQFPSEQRVSFCRPKKPGSGVWQRYVLCWFPSGEFQLWMIGSRGAWHPVPITSDKWFKIGKYLQANFASTQSILKITYV